ncbi:MAG: molecular chaperone HtpG, partial [bacterium]|nr:molecular chaperone HtpG [bacterium]
RFHQNANDDPESHLHLSSDAPVQFNSVLYIPKTNSEVYGWVKMDPGIDLYSKKILIEKSCGDILPVYLRFIKGVVDSEDIPLNISRESIQSHAIVTKIRKFILKKVIEHLNNIKKNDRETYLNIWKNFNKNIKEGIPNEYEYRDQLASLMLFESSQTPKGEYTDIEAYVEKLSEEQIEIYYATGNDFDSIDKNPALEAFKSKGLEVLYVDPMDAWAIGHMHQYKGKIFRAAEAANIKLDDKVEEEKKDAANLVTYLNTIYGDRIETVRVSERLVDSPCMLVNSPTAANIPMDQQMRKKRGRADFSKKIVEVNPSNKLIKEMIRIHKDNAGSEQLKGLAFQLLDNMILREGITEDIETIVPRIHEIMYHAARKG